MFATNTTAQYLRENCLNAAALAADFRYFLMTLRHPAMFTLDGSALTSPLARAYRNDLNLRASVVASLWRSSRWANRCVKSPRHRLDFTKPLLIIWRSCFTSRQGFLNAPETFLKFDSCDLTNISFYNFFSLNFPLQFHESGVKVQKVKTVGKKISKQPEKSPFDLPKACWIRFLVIFRCCFAVCFHYQTGNGNEKMKEDNLRKKEGKKIVKSQESKFRTVSEAFKNPCLLVGVDHLARGGALLVPWDPVGDWPQGHEVSASVRHPMPCVMVFQFVNYRFLCLAILPPCSINFKKWN